MNVEKLASICHDANASYCRTLGDFSQLPWDSAPLWQRNSIIDGVKFHLSNPVADPERSHENWMKVKLEEGWVYGEQKDPPNKTHPCLVPFNELSEEQQFKDRLVCSVIDTFRDVLS